MAVSAQTFHKVLTNFMIEDTKQSRKLTHKSLVA